MKIKGFTRAVASSSERARYENARQCRTRVEAVTCCVAVVRSSVCPVLSASPSRCRSTRGFVFRVRNREIPSRAESRRFKIRHSVHSVFSERRSKVRAFISCCGCRIYPVCNGIVRFSSTPISAKNHGECNTEKIEFYRGKRSYAGFDLSAISRARSLYKFKIDT